jgi:2-polyprenyl-3-methyl-5-hydroxy-6-metoxy-1,4-benzoquinol methylase
MNAKDLGLRGRILLRFCRPPGTADYATSGIHYVAGEELERLEEVFPDFLGNITGKLVIDFGCGEAYQAVAFARAGAGRVVGIEIDEDRVSRGHKRIAEAGLEATVSLERSIPAGLKADVIVSQNSFEHFLDAEGILAQLRNALAPGGKLFVTFAPPWYAPWGAHMGFFCKLPYVQLIFPESTVMEVRSLFRSDNVRTYREAGLAQMSIANFEHLVKSSGFQLAYKRYDCIFQMNWLGQTPARELFVNRVSCVLT